MMTYYTPSHWGSRLLEGIESTSPTGILDPAVGDASLLLCSAKRFPDSSLFGVDVDPIAVAKSKRALPNAVISHANGLELSSLANSSVWRRREEIDTVVINPPFSGNRKTYEIRVGGRNITCSIAAAHLLLSIKHYAPVRLAAIMPSSFFHSDRDSQAVESICQAYKIERAGDLHRAAFARGRASSEIVYFHRHNANGTSVQIRGEHSTFISSKLSGIRVNLVRGSMPVHSAAGLCSASGLPFVHTKGLLGKSKVALRVSPMHRGVVTDISILLPRVGMPNRQHLRVREFCSPIQLSDCVLALCFPSIAQASEVCAELHQHFDRLLDCWAGTGAPYTTVSKVSHLLQSLGIVCRISSNWLPTQKTSINGHESAVDIGHFKTEKVDENSKQLTY